MAREYCFVFGIKIAEELLPMVNDVVKVLGNWPEKFSKLDDKTQRIIVLISGTVATIGPLLIIIGNIDCLAFLVIIR